MFVGVVLRKPKYARRAWNWIFSRRCIEEWLLKGKVRQPYSMNPLINVLYKFKREEGAPLHQIPLNILRMLKSLEHRIERARILLPKRRKSREMPRNLQESIEWTMSSFNLIKEAKGLMRFLVKIINEDLEGETVRPLKERYFKVLLIDAFSSERALPILREPTKMAMSSANWINSQSLAMNLFSLET